MKREDLVVGAKYVVTQSTGEYLARGAVVKLLSLAEGSTIVIVQDLSENKKGDGQWCISCAYLESYHPPKAKRSVVETPPTTAPATYSEHYETAHQPIETMQANMTHAEFIGFLKGNIIKYACRCGRKDDPKKEAAKIRRYANWLVDALDGKIIDPRKEDER